MEGGKKQVPVREGLWTDEEKPQLVGSECQGSSFKDIKLSRRGKIYSYSVVMQRPPVYYRAAEVPYALGWVELPEGVRVETLFTGCNPDEIKVGMTVEMLVDKLHTEEDGSEVLCYKFRPVAN